MDAKLNRMQELQIVFLANFIQVHNTIAESIGNLKFLEVGNLGSMYCKRYSYKYEKKRMLFAWENSNGSSNYAIIYLKPSFIARLLRARQVYTNTINLYHVFSSIFSLIQKETMKAEMFRLEDVTAQNYNLVLITLIYYMNFVEVMSYEEFIKTFKEVFGCDHT